ncbi:hypothetical protein Nepgr_011119 [Nepenthes gracilis]|uniref:Uncharacterized protein n=1 Tax=Nepenthes gracilis TaxID=150966 RepID=A0AAD3SDP3_NEPGR|nr:hypothetical protein Nepgr_011119 [Nepenthes gracilis]
MGWLYNPSSSEIKTMSSNCSKDIYNHGMALDPQNKKVQCNYCGQVLAGFNRLQHHLGGIRGQVRVCEDVPLEVKELFKNSSAVVKSMDLGKEAGDFCHLGLSLKRDCPSSSKGNDAKRNKDESARSGWSGSSTHLLVDSVAKNSLTELPSNDNGRSAVFSGEGQESSSLLAKKCIGRFFYENGIDFGAAETPSFQKMMEIAFNGFEIEHHIPSSQDLKGLILDSMLDEIQNYVKGIRQSWPSSGCSILLDGWIDGKGRNLINVIVDCPLGPVYLRSVDVSAVAVDVNALKLFLEGVIEEVGVKNVVQVISYTTSEYMETVGKQLMEKYRSLFWTVSATHCVALMLEKIAQLGLAKRTIDRAKVITKFIYSHASILKLMRAHIGGYDLVKPSKIKAATTFLTLENILMEKKNLESMFASVEWATSPWSLKIEGKKVAQLVGDKSFWCEVTIVVKATIPLVRVLSLVNGDRKPYMGFIYETLDQVKETISQELGMRKTQYMPFWEIIDEIWNSFLHSPLHAAGYFLNPNFHYTEDFCSDSEVAGGLLITIVRMVEDQHTQDLVSQQLNVYRGCLGGFERGTENDKQNSFPPAAWWSCFGGHCPDLQKLAIRILSQTCTGAESYGLRRDLAEKLLTNGRNPIEQHRLNNLAYVHYNLQLKHSKVVSKFDIEAHEVDPLDDWVVNEAYQKEEARVEDLVLPQGWTYCVEWQDAVIAYKMATNDAAEEVHSHDFLFELRRFESIHKMMDFALGVGA